METSILLILAAGAALTFMICYRLLSREDETETDNTSATPLDNLCELIDSERQRAGVEIEHVPTDPNVPKVPATDEQGSQPGPAARNIIGPPGRS